MSTDDAQDPYGEVVDPATPEQVERLAQLDREVAAREAADRARAAREAAADAARARDADRGRRP